MQGVHLRKYNVETTISFELYEVDGVDLRTDWTPAAADCQVSKDEGTSTQCTNTASAIATSSGMYKIVLTATEMAAARIILRIVDAATKVFLDKVIMIETYGHASAMHAMDFDDADGSSLTEVGGDGAQLTEAGGDGDHLTAINLPNQTMDITGSITGNLSGTVGSVTGAVGSVAGNVDGDVSGNVDGTVTGKTPAEAGDAMNLAADAIKAVSYDESTAFPVKSDDSGATEIARTGADSDTLETLSDEIAALNDISPAEVNAEVVDALNVDTYAEPGQGAPPATASLITKLGYMYKSWRNKKDNEGSTTQLYDDAGTTVDQKQTTSEAGGTVTKAEWVTGP